MYYMTTITEIAAICFYKPYKEVEFLGYKKTAILNYLIDNNKIDNTLNIKQINCVIKKAKA